MNESSGLRVLAGGPGDAVPGFLRLANDDGADVPYCAGDEFPFNDRAVDEIVCGKPIADIAPALRVPFLLECRRVLRSGGRLRLCASTRFVSEWRRLVRLVGLDDVADERAPYSSSPRAAKAFAEVAALPPLEEDCVALDVAKRDRGLSGEPLVSIVIPAFNPRFFAASLDSALAQSWRNVEIVIGDDSPGPEIESIARKRAGAVPIRYERNATRLRTRGNCIRCFERAQGEFIKFLNDDDVLAPGCVETLLGAFRASPDITLATSCRACIDEFGRAFPDLPATMPILGETRVVAGHSLANAMIVAGLNVVGEPSTALFRKADLVDQAPGYFRFDDIEGLGIVDMVTWAALLLRGDAVYFRERLSSFRVHAAQRQHAAINSDRAIAGIRSLQAAWLPLGIADTLPPNLLVTKPYPPRDGDEWQLERVLSFAPPRMAPEAWVATWRAERAASAQ
jgi:glycosyltransferase involved in cell wall biosynthesis